MEIGEVAVALSHLLSFRIPIPDALAPPSWVWKWRSTRRRAVVLDSGRWIAAPATHVWFSPTLVAIFAAEAIVPDDVGAACTRYAIATNVEVLASADGCVAGFFFFGSLDHLIQPEPAPRIRDVVDVLRLAAIAPRLHGPAARACRQEVEQMLARLPTDSARFQRLRSEALRRLTDRRGDPDQG